MLATTDTKRTAKRKGRRFQSFGGAEWGGGPASDPFLVQFTFALALTRDRSLAKYCWFVVPRGCHVAEAARVMGEAWNAQSNHICPLSPTEPSGGTLAFPAMGGCEIEGLSIRVTGLEDGVVVRRSMSANALPIYGLTLRLLPAAPI